jgi:hypothetical protein
MFNKKWFLTIWLLGAPIVGVAQDRAALGPIESVSRSKSTITVLGQTFVVNGKTQITIDGRAVTARAGMLALDVNQYAYVEGKASRDGVISVSIAASSYGYVPGASDVFVLGSVDQVYPLEGQVRVGSLRIDMAYFSASLQSILRVGTIINIRGTQPVPRGTLVTPTFSIGAHSVGGSGVLSIGGSGVQSIGGSGILSIGGSGVSRLAHPSAGGEFEVYKQSIGGSGTQSIGGSGTHSIGGSGTLSIGGSGIN